MARWEALPASLAGNASHRNWILHCNFSDMDYDAMRSVRYQYPEYLSATDNYMVMLRWLIREHARGFKQGQALASRSIGRSNRRGAACLHPYSQRAMHGRRTSAVVGGERHETAVLSPGEATFTPLPKWVRSLESVSDKDRHLFAVYLDATARRLGDKNPVLRIDRDRNRSPEQLFTL